MIEIMQSIQPKWCELIISGKKTIEVRKTRPKCDTPFKVYIYCTSGAWLIIGTENAARCYYGNGKVIGEYICDEVLEYPYIDDGYSSGGDYLTITREGYILMCLDRADLLTYGNGDTLYGWHISNLKIYDTPKDICEFYHPCPYTEKPCSLCKYADWENNLLDCRKVLKRPPQSWCYVM